MIIDVHAHIFPDAIAEKASVSISKFYDIPVKQGGSVDALLRLGDEAGIDKFVVHSVATTPAHVRSVNKFIASAVKAHPDRFIGFGSLHPDMNDARDAVRHLEDEGLRGIKLHIGMRTERSNCLKALRANCRCSFTQATSGISFPIRTALQRLWNWFSRQRLCCPR